MPDAENRAVAIYLKLGSIQGSAMTSGFENWISLESFQWGFAAGYTAKQSNSEVSVREVVLTMRAEKASPLIVSAGVSRTVLPTAVFKFTTTAKDKVDTYMTYEFANCVITNYAIAAPGEGAPTETLSLSFTTVTETFNPRDSKLTGAPTTVTYDVRSAKAS
jgi:type VI secretion system Hcp family effector